MSRPDFDNVGGRRRPDAERTKLFDEISQLVCRLHDDTAQADEAQRLADVISQDDEAREFYLFCSMLTASLSWENARTKVDPVALNMRPDQATQPATTQPASTQPAPSSRSPVLGFLGTLLHIGHETSVTAALMWLVMGIITTGIVLTLLFCITLIFRGADATVHGDGPNVAGSRGAEMGRSGDGEMGRDRPSTNLPASNASVARLIHTADCRWAIGSHSPHLGDDLEPGRKLELLSGLAEVMFESGVRALLQGPATMEIASRKAAKLHQGKLTVRVDDPDARGFEVDAPGMKYTDLGTEFGVSVKRDGTQEMIVFRGQVRAETRPYGETGKMAGHSISPSPYPPISPSSLVLTAHQAIRVASPGRPMERIAADKRQFVRLTPLREPFGIFGTGVGLDRGAADPHWTLAKISTDANFAPQPAVVADPIGSYAVGSRNKGQWISKSKKLAGEPDGALWTFCTHFDLNGFDASTARIEGRISADDYIAEIRLNGKTMPVPNGSRDRTLNGKWLELQIQEGFVADDNTLEIVVENAVMPGVVDGNTMALCVDWTGTAVKTEKE
jgi:hypothetical protein